MGTNYYVKTNECKCCNRYDERHIGKSSVGWAFNFRGYVDDNLSLRSWQDWKLFLKDKTIFTEYGQEVEYDNFVGMIETFKSPGYFIDGRANKDHINCIYEDYMYRDVWEEYRDETKHWHCQDGYSFSNQYFS